jgi:Na+-transporting methylmalonyl-CoA/oxaloacetate decarboxylase gamma subunit
MIAFTIVFIVLAGLTAVIYAIKFFSGVEDGRSDKKDQGTPVPVSPAPATAAPVSAAAAPSDKGRVTAVITAAILAATQGRGRILSIAPASLRANVAVASNWRTSGIVERVGSRLVRGWKH